MEQHVKSPLVFEKTKSEVGHLVVLDPLVIKNFNISISKRTQPTYCIKFSNRSPPSLGYYQVDWQN